MAAKQLDVITDFHATDQRQMEVDVVVVVAAVAVVLEVITRVHCCSQLLTAMTNHSYCPNVNVYANENEYERDYAFHLLLLMMNLLPMVTKEWAVEVLMMMD